MWDHYSSLSEDERPAYVEERRKHALTMHEVWFPIVLMIIISLIVLQHAKVVAAWESEMKIKQSEEEDIARKSREER